MKQKKTGGKYAVLYFAGKRFIYIYILSLYMRETNKIALTYTTITIPVYFPYVPI